MQGKVLYLHSPTPSAFCSRAPLRWIVCLGCPEAQCGLAAGNVRLSWWCCRGRGLLRMQQGVLGTVWCDQLASFWIWSTDFGSYNSLLIPLSSFFFFLSVGCPRWKEGFLFLCMLSQASEHLELLYGSMEVCGWAARTCFPFLVQSHTQWWQHVNQSMGRRKEPSPACTLCASHALSWKVFLVYFLLYECKNKNSAKWKTLDDRSSKGEHFYIASSSDNSSRLV